MITTLTVLTPETRAEIAAEMRLRHTSEIFVLFPLGSQTDHLIKLALDRLGVYCLVADPSQIRAADLVQLRPTGILLSGGPASAYHQPPDFDDQILELGVPVLGICLGFQLWAQYVGVDIAAATKREYGTHQLEITRPNSPLLAGIENRSPVLQSHSDYVAADERQLTILARTDNAAVAAAQRGHLWGVQFHPEVSATTCGDDLLANFCFNICGARDSYPAPDQVQHKVELLRQRIGQRKVLLALSGGSDSAVVAYLLMQALVDRPGQLRAIYIQGLDRPDDETDVKRYFGYLSWIDLQIVDATKPFLAALAGRLTMADKRLAVREVYKAVLEAQAHDFDADFIAQGTLYTDLSESGGGHQSGARKAKIKLHHNADLKFSRPELIPLSDCVKDTARQIGRSLGVPEELLIRHPFPGPGLSVRIEGEVTAPKLAVARQADGIFIDELRRAGLYGQLWQAGAVVTSSTTTYTKGDDAGTGLVLALWAVTSVNGFTAHWAELPIDFLRHVSRRLTNEIPEIGAVVYRISDKPPTTIEWG